MQEQDYTSLNIKKVLTFKGHEILNIDISCPRFNLKPGKKINKFYSVLANSFINYCEKKLYIQAAANFCSYPEAHEIFTAGIKFKINDEHENIKIYLEIDINGEKTRKVHVWSLGSGELIKPAEIKK